MYHHRGRRPGGELSLECTPGSDVSTSRRFAPAQYDVPDEWVPGTDADLERPTPGSRHSPGERAGR